MNQLASPLVVVQHRAAVRTATTISLRRFLVMISLLWFVLTLTACATGPPLPDIPLPRRVPGGELHGRVVDMQTLQIVTFDAMVRALAPARLIAVGEEHNHPEIQAFELQLLQALAQQHAPTLALAMEFLERDDQPIVDDYTAATIDQDTFHTRLQASSSFQRYYTPLVTYAQQVSMPTLAMNVPRRLARQVAQEGLHRTLQSLDATDRAYVPMTLPDIPARYRTYFLDAVAAHHPVRGQQAVYFTEASFLKDATMAHVLSRFLDQHPQFTVLAIAGRFHVDYGIAIPALLKQQQPHLPMRRLTTMTVAPHHQVDLHRLRDEGIADYIRFFPPARASHHGAPLSLSARPQGRSGLTQVGAVGGMREEGARH